MVFFLKRYLLDTAGSVKIDLTTDNLVLDD